MPTEAHIPASALQHDEEHQKIARPGEAGSLENLSPSYFALVMATGIVSIASDLLGMPRIARALLGINAFAYAALWMPGVLLYVWIMGFVFYRYLFLPMRPADMGAAYWIDMGAVAISTLAGVTLIGNSGSDPLLARLRPFVEGLTLLFWATAAGFAGRLLRRAA
jgi:tellurite resistance protein TehA-like permease